MRLLTWIPIVTLILLLGIAWYAFRTERPFTFAFDEPPVANTLADPLVPGLGDAGESIHGTLVNQDGRPVREALVKLQDGTRLRWTHSDGEGRFRLARVSAGRHTVTVVARGHVPARFEVVAGDGAERESRDPTERASTGSIRESGGEWKLTTAAPGSPSVPAGLRSDLALVLEATSAAFDPTRCEVLLLPLDDDIRQRPSLPRWAAVDGAGNCTVPQLTHGRYRALVLPDWAHGGDWPDLLSDLDGPGRVLEHPGDGPERLELRSGEIRGRITDLSTRAGSGVEFVAGALVLVRPASAGDDPDPRIWPPAPTDEQGAFLVGDLPPGRYVVTAHMGERRLEREVTVYPAATTTLDL